MDSAKAPGVDAIDMNGSLYRLVPQKRPALASFMEHEVPASLHHNADLDKWCLCARRSSRKATQDPNVQMLGLLEGIFIGVLHETFQRPDAKNSFVH